MTTTDGVALLALFALATITMLALWAGLRRRVFYRQRGRIGRLAFLVAALGPAFAVASWAPILLLRVVPPPTTAFMLRRVAPCRAAGGVAYDWVSSEELSPHAPIAFVAAEDQRFPLHSGFDVESIQRAMAEAEAGRRTRGASTISQQVVKNLFFWPGRSWVRKGLEAWGTVLLELTWPKRRILEVYVNVAQLGPCTFGVGAAARQYFGKEAADLDTGEAALLAAVLPSPERFRVDAPSDYVRQRQAWIAGQVRNLGGAAYLEAEAAPPTR